MDKDVFDDELSGKGGYGEVEPLEPAGGYPEDHAHQCGYKPCSRQGKPEGKPQPCCQDRPCIGTHAEKSPVPQRDLAGEADEDIEPQRGNGCDPDHVEHVEEVWSARKGQHEKQNDKPDGHPEPAEIGLEDGKLRSVVLFVVTAWVEVQFSHRLFSLDPLDLHQAEEPVGFYEKDEYQDDIWDHVFQ